MYDSSMSALRNINGLMEVQNILSDNSSSVGGRNTTLRLSMVAAKSANETLKLEVPRRK